jgi:hypothetical protein
VSYVEPLSGDAHPIVEILRRAGSITTEELEYQLERHDALDMLGELQGLIDSGDVWRGDTGILSAPPMPDPAPAVAEEKPVDESKLKVCRECGAKFKPRANQKTCDDCKAGGKRNAPKAPSPADPEPTLLRIAEDGPTLYDRYIEALTILAGLEPPSEHVVARLERMVALDHDLREVESEFDRRGGEWLPLAPRRGEGPA